MKIPIRVLRAAWIAGTDARWRVAEAKIRRRGHLPMSDQTAEIKWRKDRKGNEAGMRAAAEVLVKWLEGKK